MTKQKKAAFPPAHFTSGHWTLMQLRGEDGLTYVISGGSANREICRILAQFGGIKRAKANALLIRKAPSMYALLEQLANIEALKCYRCGSSKTMHDKILEVLSEIGSGEMDKTKGNDSPAVH
ncbi:MAG: hypothetical protein IKO65_04275 [Victivallales bacterium]|nr:hypothetical protein [Victivallales bacterium]